MYGSAAATLLTSLESPTIKLLDLEFTLLVFTAITCKLLVKSVGHRQVYNEWRVRGDKANMIFESSTCCDLPTATLHKELPEVVFQKARGNW
jgi:hypothetical protein